MENPVSLHKLIQDVRYLGHVGAVEGDTFVVIRSQLGGEAPVERVAERRAIVDVGVSKMAVHCAGP